MKADNTDYGECANTVVSLHASKRGSMGSYEQFVHYSLPPRHSTITNKNHAPFGLNDGREQSTDSFTHISRSNRNAVNISNAVADASLSILLEHHDSIWCFLSTCAYIPLQIKHHISYFVLVFVLGWWQADNESCMHSWMLC